MRNVFLDTSYIRTVGLRHPDFQKLLLRSKERTLRIVVSQIAWEEWRTQLLELARRKVRKLKEDFDKIKTMHADGIILQDLAPPALDIWGDEQIEEASRTALDKLVAENNIAIVPIGEDHAERAWRRYFEIGPPFNPENTDRESRRKDIPDSWILEAALDVKAEHPDLLCLCFDRRLTDALTGEGLKAFADAQSLLEDLEKAEARIDPELSHRQSISENALDATLRLEAGLERSQAQFRSLEQKVLGFVAFLEPIDKEKLTDLLGRTGAPVSVIRNIAERLVFAGVLRDTGHNLASADKELANIAAIQVEDEIIALMRSG